MIYSKLKNIETKWLEDFLTLEECRHFSQAAEKEICHNLHLADVF